MSSVTTAPRPLPRLDVPDPSADPAARIDDYLDDARVLCLGEDSRFDSLGRARIEAFQLAASQRLLARQADRLPIVAELLAGRDPASFATLDDFVAILLDEDAYKSFDQALVEAKDFAGLTRWLDRFTSHDLSGVDMAGCQSLTEWCERLNDQAQIFVCHSTGTSGTLSFIPRSQDDRDQVVDYMVYRNPHLFRPLERNDVTFFTPGVRHVYRITQALYDGLEQRHHTNPVQTLPGFHSPEFHMAQGRMRKAAARGEPDSVQDDPYVRACGAEVTAFQRDFAELTRRWTDNLIENYRGKKIYFQGSFDKAWQITRHFQQAGVSGAFAPESVFALAGGVKDGSVLPEDWLDQFREATGAAPENLVGTWGMSEITGGVPRCAHGNYHFPITIIPFLLEPGTRMPLPRSGVQTGQIALLELNSRDCWGGFVSGDRGTIDWDGTCGCGRPGPLLDPASIARI